MTTRSGQHYSIQSSAGSTNHNAARSSTGLEQGVVLTKNHESKPMQRTPEPLATLTPETPVSSSESGADTDPQLTPTISEAERPDPNLTSNKDGSPSSGESDLDTSHRLTPEASESEQAVPSVKTETTVAQSFPASIQSREDSKIAATIAVDITANRRDFPRPDGESEPLFQFIVTARIKDSSRPGTAITLDAWATPLRKHMLSVLMGAEWPFPRGHEQLLKVTRTIDGCEQELLWQVDPWLRPHMGYGHGPKDFVTEQRDRDMLTIPAEGVLTVYHNVKWADLWDRNRSCCEDDLCDAGEIWRFNLVEPEDTAPWWSKITRHWWCWGDLHGDLKQRELLGWVKGAETNEVTAPTQEELDEGIVVSEPLSAPRWEMGPSQLSILVGACNR